MTNIHTVVDTLTFRESNRLKKIELDIFYQDKVRDEFKQRFQDIETRISSTSDIDTIQKLDSAQKFFRTIATYIDMLHSHVEYMHRTFDHIDETYWNGAIHYQKLTDENKFLKNTVENLQRQRDLAVNGWSAERRKWNQNRLLNKVA